MNDFEDIQALRTYDHFTVFEAFSKSRKFPVIVKKCEYSRIEEAEFFIRSALMKTKDGAYSQPLVSIEADLSTETGSTWIIFVWKKGKALDKEIEHDRESPFPPGNNGYDHFKRMNKNPNTGASINRAQCLTLGKEIIIKKFKSTTLLGMNFAFKETLAHVKCNHPNICEFFNFSLFSSKVGMHCAYIVMERLKQDLASEIKKRRESCQIYEEAELIKILQDVTAALLCAKSHGLAHRDIKPANILRGTECLKLADFGSTWFRGLFSETESTQGSIPYMSPEALKTLGNPDLLQKPFESDVFSLGMTMLHLATTDLPPKIAGVSSHDLEALLQQAVHKLAYSDEFKRLCIAMLRPVAGERPTLEAVQEHAIRIQQLASQSLETKPIALDINIPQLDSPHQVSPHLGAKKQQTYRLYHQGRSLSRKRDYEMAVEVYSVTDSVYSLIFPNDIHTALNLYHWGFALNRVGNYTEAAEKYAASDSILSRLFPAHKDTANNLYCWAIALCSMGNYVEAVNKHEAADSIYSRLFANDKDTANNLNSWGFALDSMGNYSEAVKKYAAANWIYARFFPDDKDTAGNLRNWGFALCNMENYSEAVRMYEAADCICSWFFPHEKDTAINLYNWGIALNKMESYSEAVDKHAAAHSIYSRFFPNDKGTAKNLNNSGNALLRMGNYSEAVGKYAAADSIFSRLFPNDKDTATNLNDWGLALQKMDNCSEAVGKHAAADSILSRSFPNDINTAINFKNWGDILISMGNNAKAMGKYAAADSIYSQLFPNEKDTALNLKHWGIAHFSMENYSETMGKYATADCIYSRLPNDVNTAINLRNWGDILINMGNYSEAVGKYAAADSIFSRLPNDKDTALNLKHWGTALRILGTTRKLWGSMQP